ncbi:MAG: division/cell wall cluster transcriptional repressor MraZ [Deltaproteobacteria bacterium]|nr:division/cell wall cluster transcriptional repressor MraZ [Deltaproteobacteria bacterium]
MFRGHFEHLIDPKGRTSLPSRFRDVLPAAERRLVVTPALFDPCIDVYPMPAWEEFEARVADLPKWDPDVVLLRRRYVSAAVECDIDRQGRVLVPPSLRAHAGLVKDVLWAGMGRTIELWARERWQAADPGGEAASRLRAVIGEKLRL